MTASALTFQAVINPYAAGLQLAFFCAQRWATLKYAPNKEIYEAAFKDKPYLNLLIGPQGPYFSSTVATGLLGAVGAWTGNAPELTLACLYFLPSQIVQTTLRSGVFLSDAPKGTVKARIKNLLLACADVGMVWGLSHLAVSGGVPAPMVDAIKDVGTVFAATRFALAEGGKPKWIHSDIVALDMMLSVVTTAYHAYKTGHTTEFYSRLEAFIGYSRLAVDRAKDSGETSLFEIETHGPKALGWCRKVVMQPS